MRRKRIGWTRRERVVNPADPTQVIDWRLKLGRLSIELADVTWGIDARVWWRGRKLYRSWDGWLATRLLSWLEGRYQDKQQEYDEAEAYYGRNY